MIGPVQKALTICTVVEFINAVVAQWQSAHPMSGRSWDRGMRIRGLTTLDMFEDT